MTPGDNGDTLLTDLCAVCHINPIKYTCPRCGIHTCSLPCVKKHKLRAQCSGLRDPAAYKKRSELATPASIDQDYNFISKVERSLQRADDDAMDRGINLAPARELRFSEHRKSKTDWELEACGVKLIRAPKGLSRSKQNTTHWDNRHKCLMWTIEWVLQDGRSVIANSRGTTSILDAFRNAVGKRGMPRKRKAGDLSQEIRSHGTDEVENKVEPQTDEKNVNEPRTDESVKTTKRPAEHDIHFYIHRPRTTSKLKCLIPVKPELSISEALQQKTVIEFPTLYARHEPPQDLQEPFITESAYLEHYGEELAPVLPPHSDSDLEPGELVSLPHADLDEKKVLEVLKRDLVG